MQVGSHRSSGSKSHGDVLLGNYTPIPHEDTEEIGAAWGSESHAHIGTPLCSDQQRVPEREAHLGSPSTVGGSTVHTLEIPVHNRRLSEHRHSLLDEVDVQALLASSPRRAALRRHSKTLELPHELTELVDHAPAVDQHLNGILESNSVQMTVGLVIMFNAAVIGGETDYPDWEVWGYLEKLFLAFFLAELGAKVYIRGLVRFFCECDQDIAWNLFDFVVVALGVFDVLTEMFQSNKEQGGTATIFRLVRLLRILRVFRLFRMLKQLYLLAAGFAEAAQAVIWVTILMAFVLYTCSIILVRTLGHDPEADSFWIEKYGTIPTSMLTLFKLMSQPDLEPYHSRLAHHPVLTLFLVMFIIFGSFGMIALLTGVISESMFDKNQTRIEEERIEREVKRDLLATECENLFDLLLEKEGADDGELPTDNLESILPFITQLFKDLTVPYTSYDLKDVIAMMDLDGSGTVDRQEFQSSIISVSDGIRPIAFMELSHRVSHVKQKVETLTERTRSIETKLIEAEERRKSVEIGQNTHWENVASTQKAILQAIQELKTRVDSNHDQTENLSKSVHTIKERVDTNQMEVLNVSRSLPVVLGQVQAVKVAVDSHAMNLMAGMHARESEIAQGMRFVRTAAMMRDTGSDAHPSRADQHSVMQESMGQDVPPPANQPQTTGEPPSSGSIRAAPDIRSASPESGASQSEAAARHCSGNSSANEEIVGDSMPEPALLPEASPQIQTSTSSAQVVAKGIRMNLDSMGLPSEVVNSGTDPSAGSSMNEALADMMRRFNQRQHLLADEVASRVLDQLASSQALVLQASSGETPERTLSGRRGNSPLARPS